MACEDITEEKHFVRLFEETLELNRGDISDDDISDAVIEVINSFVGNIACPIKIYQTPERLWAYFFRFSPISAGLTRFHMLEAIRNNGALRTFLERSSLKVLSIGSGPGSDLIGLCSALYDNADFQKLNLTLVDNNERWRSLFQAMIHVIRHDEYGNASKLFQEKEINYSFICSDVLNTAAYCDALSNADVVWMKGLLSVLSNNTVRYRAIRAVISSIPVGSLLVVIDSPTYHMFENFQDDLQLLYSAGAESYYFSENPFKSYGPGLCRKSNQIITVHTKIWKGKN
ncbi:UNVERIFIED_CONTAM: hypothetical protein NCL1_19550 [Trichonephila clavipes]